MQTSPLHISGGSDIDMSKQRYPLRLLAVAAVSVALVGCETTGAVNQAGQQQSRVNHRNNIASISEVIKTNPTDANALNLRGSALGQAGEYQKALADFNAALALTPNYYQAYANRALIYVKMKRLDQAMADYNQAISLAPDYGVAYVGRANLYRAMNNMPMALADYGKAIQIQADDPIAYFNRGLVHQAMNDHSSAVDDFTMALGMRPEEPEAAYARGLSNLALQQYKKAYEDFVVVSNTKKDNHEVWTYRGRAAEGAGDAKEASRAYKRALQISPFFRPASEGLSRVGRGEA